MYVDRRAHRPGRWLARQFRAPAAMVASCSILSVASWARSSAPTSCSEPTINLGIQNEIGRDIATATIGAVIVMVIANILT